MKLTRQFKGISRKVGLSPGTIVYTGEARTSAVRIDAMEYDETHVVERTNIPVAECSACRDSAEVSWLNVIGVHDTQVIESIGAQFQLHPLVLEDIVHPGQRPKAEDYDAYAYIVLNMLRWEETKQEITSEQVSLILGPRHVLTFQEETSDVFDNVRARIRGGKGRIRKLGADYLAYALVDAVVDNYFLVLEKMGERIEQLQDALLDNPTPHLLQQVHQIKRELIALRRSVWPLREAIGSLERDGITLLSPSTTPFLRDLYDHTIQVIDTVETYRDLAAGLLDIYLSSISNRMNEVMKVLTVISTIFIPLTFVAGVYGMNFEHMPELKWPYGYACVWGLMITMATAMLINFRRRNWL